MRKSLHSNSFFHFIICSSHLKCLHTAIESCYSNICSMLRMNLVFFMIVFVENALEIVFSATDLLLFLLLWLKWVVAAWLPIGNLLAKNLSNCESNHIIYSSCRWNGFYSEQTLWYVKNDVSSAKDRITCTHWLIDVLIMKSKSKCKSSAGLNYSQSKSHWHTHTGWQYCRENNLQS